MALAQTQDLFDASVAGPWAWAGFLVFVLAMVAVDLAVVQRHPHRPSSREALGWSLAWVGISLTFALGLGFLTGADNASLFLSGYVLEKALSVDNLFVFIVIFHALRIPPQFQHRVLFWGVLGALVMRALMIFAGIELLSRFHILVRVLGGFLVLTGLRVGWQWLRHRGEPGEPPRLLGWVQKVVRATTTVDAEGHFFLRENGRRVATPLLVALVAVELADVLFAVDSVPAVLAVTEDMFLVFTSNVLAILGLRSLYFLLQRAMGRFRFLPLGLAAVLCFVGGKMLAASALHVSAYASLAVILGVLGVSVAVSLMSTPPGAGTPSGT